ncbi:MAG: efflux RND transporter periplasmic adaptor subunit, partial [Gemmatimonadota bacterium]
LVDETDIGKIQPGMEVTITVDAYQNRPFSGRVLKIEPQATVTQNVTMFPVLVRIPNTNALLKPGMNSEVEVHVGARQGVLAVPNTALRTDRDVNSAAEVLGLDLEAVRDQIAQARTAAAGGTSPGPSTDESAAGDNSRRETVTWRGQEIQLPEGVSAEAVRALQAKFEGASDRRAVFQSLTPDERALMQQLMQAAGGGRGGFGGPGGPGQGLSVTDAALAGGEYIVFALRDGVPTAVPIRTGLTDLDYSEVVSGLTEGDTVLVLPSASLLASQREFQERIADRVGGIPGVQRR